jgi:hypothetical protein
LHPNGQIPKSKKSNLNGQIDATLSSGDFSPTINRTDKSMDVHRPKKTNSEWLKFR